MEPITQTAVLLSFNNRLRVQDITANSQMVVPILASGSGSREEIGSMIIKCGAQQDS